MEKLFKNLVEQHTKFTKSKYSQKILYEWGVNVNHFVQICPLEMLDKLDNPISNKSLKQKLANFRFSNSNQFFSYSFKIM